MLDSHKNKLTSNETVNNVLEILKKNIKPIIAIILYIIMIVILAKCTSPSKNEIVIEKPDTQEETDVNSYDIKEQPFIEVPEALETLMNKYYKFYAEGNYTKAAKVAKPMSETEKSYMEVISGLIESYDDIEVYAREGLNEGEYLVSTIVNIKPEGIDGTAPSLDTFYVRTSAKGNFYIDNAYSQFNQSNMENSTEADIQGIINASHESEDMEKLQEKVQSGYDSAVSENEELKKFFEETVPNAIADWISGLEKAPEEDEEVTQVVLEFEKAYVLTRINIRGSANTNGDILATVDKGTEIEACDASTDENGWCSVKFNGYEGYVMREYITFDKADLLPKELTEETNANDNAGNNAGDNNANAATSALPQDKEITIKTTTNIRSSMSTDSDKVGVAYGGDKVTVVMSYAEGWTKVTWKEKTGYIRTDILSEQQ